MELFTRDDFEKLGKIEEKVCASIYIPTHEAGMEVNQNIDRIAFKNEVQKIKEKLDGIGYRTPGKFLAPCINLINDIMFWKEQSKGLAVFVTENNFWKYRVPVSLETHSIISPAFDLTPLLPLLKDEDVYFSLSLSQNKVKLFRNTSFTFNEIGISHLIPENIEEILSYYEFEKSAEGRSMDVARQKGSGPKANLAVHSSNPEDKMYKYVLEFLKKVNTGVMQVLKNETGPLVVAAADYIFGQYQTANTYRHLLPKGVIGNPDYLSDRELHERSYIIARDILNRPRRKDINKYSVLAGTGKTSYDLNTILSAAYDGRVESLFILEDSHIWGTFDIHKRSARIHDSQEKNDQCLLSLAAAQTVENNGKAYMVQRFEMPEIEFETPIAAVFRY
ncbi:MAG: hypothetical protein K2X86_16525 [Cytophagaceae bacterium]|nr:hypothetical protein [Cytophagaceae bacterium]